MHCSFALECVIYILNNTFFVGSVGHLKPILQPFKDRVNSPYSLGLAVYTSYSACPESEDLYFMFLNSLHSAATADVYSAKERSWTNSFDVSLHCYNS